MKLLNNYFRINGLMSLLLVLLISLSGCNVRPSFGYAFWGTGAVMIVALVIATVVTRRAKQEGERD